MDDLDTPNCPEHLVRMEAEERGSAVVWARPECGLVRV